MARFHTGDRIHIKGTDINGEVVGTEPPGGIYAILLDTGRGAFFEERMLEEEKPAPVECVPVLPPR